MALHDFLLTPYTPIVLLILYYVLPYFTSNSSLRDIPSPRFASFSNLWLLFQCRLGRRYASVHAAHARLGKVVRIQPDHVSIADPDAIPVIYGHGNGFLKASYYDVFVSIHRGLFNTRDRAEHTRKRKTISHTFSAKNIARFEEYMHANLTEFVKQWTRLSDSITPSTSDGEKKAGKGYVTINALDWFNYLAFDIIGDLAFGQPFGMIAKGQDIAEIQMEPNGPITYAPAVEVLNRRGEVSGTLGCIPELKPYAKYLPDPFFSRGLKAVEKLAGIATARVGARLELEKSDEEAGGEGKGKRMDLLARLMEGRDEKGEKLGRAELTAEALTQLIAGSDTTSNTSCALLYWVTKTPGVIDKLQKELDLAIPEGVEVPTYAMVKDLPYVQMVIQETLRIHSTSSLGLPRVVPPGDGVDILGHHFPPGTVLSVPAYTIHHSAEVWGPDVEEFKPERWENVTEKQKAAFIPFSVGPRSCVGRNVAEMELTLIVATVFRGFEFELLEKGELMTREGFLRKPVVCMVGLRKR